MSARLSDPTSAVGDPDEGDPEEMFFSKVHGRSPSPMGDPFILPILGMLARAVVPTLLGGVAQHVVGSLLPSSTGVQDPLASRIEEEDTGEDEDEEPEPSPARQALTSVAEIAAPVVSGPIMRALPFRSGGVLGALAGGREG